MAAFRVFKLNVIAKVFYITKEICPGYAEAMLSFTQDYIRHSWEVLPTILEPVCCRNVARNYIKRPMFLNSQHYFTFTEKCQHLPASQPRGPSQSSGDATWRNRARKCETFHWHNGQQCEWNVRGITWKTVYSSRRTIILRWRGWAILLQFGRGRKMAKELWKEGETIAPQNVG